MNVTAQFGYPGDYVLWWLVFLSLVVHTWCFFRFFPRQRRKKTGLILGNLLVLVCFLGAAFLAGESYFRYAAVETDAFGMSLPARRWFNLYVRTNAAGCRDDEWARAKPAGTRRIAFVGDSYVYGWGIEKTQDRFPELIEARFNGANQARVEVMNVAKPGWGTRDQIQPIRDMIEHYDVDEVVLCHVVNDIEDRLPVSPNFNPTLPPDPDWLNPDASYLLDFLRMRIVVPRLPTVRNYQRWLAGGYATESLSGAHEEDLRTIIRECSDHGVALRVVLLPMIQTATGELDQSSIHRRLVAMLEEEQVPVVDLWPVIAGRDASELVVSRIDAHPNESAQHIFADVIWRAFYDDKTP